MNRLRPAGFLLRPASASDSLQSQRYPCGSQMVTICDSQGCLCGPQARLSAVPKTPADRKWIPFATRKDVFAARKIATARISRTDSVSIRDQNRHFVRPKHIKKCQSSTVTIQTIIYFNNHSFIYQTDSSRLQGTTTPQSNKSNQGRPTWL